MRIGDWRARETLLADGTAEEVAPWERRRVRAALRRHGTGAAALDGATDSGLFFAMTVGGARDGIEAQVRLLLSVAADLDGEGAAGPPCLRA